MIPGFELGYDVAQAMTGSEHDGRRDQSSGAAAVHAHGGVTFHTTILVAALQSFGPTCDALAAHVN